MNINLIMLLSSVASVLQKAINIALWFSDPLFAYNHDPVTPT